MENQQSTEDVAQQQDRNARRRAARESERTSKASTAKVRRPELTPEQIAAAAKGWQELLGMVFLGAQMFVPDPYAPTAKESADITAPASRIIARHYPIPELGDDVSDGMALVIAVVGYGTRVVLSPGPAAPVPPSSSPGRPRPAGTTQQPHTAEGQNIRFATAGEGTGVAPEDLVGPPDDVLRKLHEAAYLDPEALGV